MREWSSKHGDSDELSPEEYPMLPLNQPQGAPRERNLVKRPVAPFKYRFGILLALTLQISTYTLLRRYSQAIRKETYSSGSVLCASEFMKLVVSAFGIWVVRPSRADQTMVEWFKHLATTALPMCVPAICYLAMNILSFFALKRIDAATFSLIFQLKLVTTAFFSRVLLNRSYYRYQYSALCLVVLGVIQITLNTHPGADPCKQPELVATPEPPKGFDFINGVVAVLMEVTLSGLSTVYMEKVFKQVDTGLSIWDRNFQLAACSIPVYVALVFAFQSGDHSGHPTYFHVFFAGWSVSAFLLALLGALGGLLVAVSLKYTDSILKSFASTGGIIITTTVAWLLLNGPLNAHILIASVMVVVGVLNYTSDPMS